MEVSASCDMRRAAPVDNSANFLEPFHKGEPLTSLCRLHTMNCRSIVRHP